MVSEYNIFRIKEGGSNEAFLLVENNKNTLMSRDKLKEYIVSEEIKKYLKDTGERLGLNEAKDSADYHIYMARNVDDVAYLPYSVVKNSDNITEHNGRSVYNLYRKAKMWNEDFIKNLKTTVNTDTKVSKPKCIENLLFNLLENDESLVKEFKIWLSQILFNPRKKHPVAFIFIGAPGSGKGRLKEWVLSRLFGDNLFEIGQQTLNSSYNEFMMKVQLVFANEVFQSDNRFSIPSKLKQLVTDENIPVEKKYAHSRYITNFTNWCFASNAKNPLKIECDDRRYYVIRSEKIDKKLVIELRDSVEEEIYNFAKQLYQIYLEHEDYCFEPTMNNTKEEIILTNKNSIETFIHLIETDDTLWQRILKYNYAVLENVTPEISYSDFYAIYSKFSRELGFRPFSFNKFIIEIKEYTKEGTKNIVDLHTIRNDDERKEDKKKEDELDFEDNLI